MTPATATTGPSTPLNQQGGPAASPGPIGPARQAPTASLPVGPGDFKGSDFPDIAEPPRPVTLVYRPGEPVIRNDLRNPSLRQVIQSLCFDLGLRPAELDFGRDGPERAWVLADRIAEDGAVVQARVGRVYGLSDHWLRMGRAELIDRRWAPVRDYPAAPDAVPPPPDPPASSDVFRGPA